MNLITEHNPNTKKRYFLGHKKYQQKFHSCIKNTREHHSKEITETQNDYRRPLGYLLNPLDQLFKLDYNDNQEWYPEDPVLQHIYDIVHELHDDRRYLDIDELEIDIKKETLTFVTIGARLALIHFDRLHKKTHSSFDQYCQDNHGISYFKAIRYIKASNVYMTLMRSGIFTYLQLPKNVEQCLAVACYEDDELIEKWKSIVRKFQPHQYSGERFKQYLYPEPVKKGIDTRIDVGDPEILLELEKYAIKYELSMSQLMAHVLAMLQAYEKTFRNVIEQTKVKRKKKLGRRKIRELWEKQLTEINRKFEQFNPFFNSE